MVRVVYANNSDTNWVASAPPKVGNLLREIARDPIDLLDHRFGQDFDLNAYLDSRNRAPRNHEARIDYRGFARNNLAKRSVPSSSCYSASAVLHVEYALALPDRLNQLPRPIDLIEILIEVHGDEVALGRRAVPVDTVFKKSSKLSEQTIFKVERGVRQGGAILSRGFSDDEGDVVVLVGRDRAVEYFSAYLCGPCATFSK